MLPKVKLVFDRKKVSGAKNEGDVEVYVYHNAKKRYLSTGVRVRKREYRDGVVSCRAKQATAMVREAHPGASE